jgi:hypothetical protein
MDRLRGLHSGFADDRLQKIADLVPVGIITDPSDVGGYPDYKGQPYADADKDGMPDEWEQKNGLNPNDPSDAAADKTGDGYTNIEKFLYRLDTTKKVDWRDLRNNVDTLAPQPIAAR